MLVYCEAIPRLKLSLDQQIVSLIKLSPGLADASSVARITVGTRTADAAHEGLFSGLKLSLDTADALTRLESRP